MLVFLVGALLGVLLGGALCVRYRPTPDRLGAGAQPVDLFVSGGQIHRFWAF